jgi:hypothetical protein
MVVVLTSCGTGDNKALAETAVATFHSQLDAGQFGAIYADADDRFQKATTAADFSALVGAIHQKLGSVQQSALRNYNVGWYSGQGAVVTLVYETQFAGGSGTEQFTWHVQNKRPQLLGYHINSNALILKSALSCSGPHRQIVAYTLPRFR